MNTTITYNKQFSLVMHRHLAVLAGDIFLKKGSINRALENVLAQHSNLLNGLFVEKSGLTKALLTLLNTDAIPQEKIAKILREIAMLKYLRMQRNPKHCFENRMAKLLSQQKASTLLIPIMTLAKFGCNDFVYEEIPEDTTEKPARKWVDYINKFVEFQEQVPCRKANGHHSQITPRLAFLCKDVKKDKETEVVKTIYRRPVRAISQYLESMKVVPPYEIDYVEWIYPGNDVFHDKPYSQTRTAILDLEKIVQQVFKVYLYRLSEVIKKKQSMTVFKNTEKSIKFTKTIQTGLSPSRYFYDNSTEQALMEQCAKDLSEVQKMELSKPILNAFLYKIVSYYCHFALRYRQPRYKIYRGLAQVIMWIVSFFSRKTIVQQAVNKLQKVKAQLELAYPGIVELTRYTNFSKVSQSQSLRLSL